MNSCLQHAKGNYIDLVTYISTKTPNPSAAENQKVVVGAPEVVYVYAYDDYGRREQQFSDKYLYLNLSSVEYGCNLELTLQSSTAAGVTEAEEEDESENSEDS